MGVIPLQSAHSAKTTDDCRLCVETSQRQAASSSRRYRFGQIVALALLASAGLFLFAIEGVAPWIFGGVAAGVLAGAIYHYRDRLGFYQAARDAHARELREISEDADNRVQSIIKQFEWAVNDLARLKSQLERSEASVRTLTERARDREHQNEQLVRQISRLRERLTEIAMAASLTPPAKESSPALEPVPFTWGLHFDGLRARLELETRAGAELPTAVRIIDQQRQIVSATAVSLISPDGVLEFQLEPPLDLVADLDAGRNIAYTIETFADHEWRSVRLQDTGRRTTSAVDVKGHVARARTNLDRSLVASGARRNPALN